MFTPRLSLPTPPKSWRKWLRRSDRGDEAAKYAKLSEDIKAAFNKAYVSLDGRIKGDTQAGYALALHFNILPEDSRPKAMEHLLEAIKKFKDHPSTGIQSSYRMMLELTRNGRHDEAWRLINLRTVPSWGYMVEMGATHHLGNLGRHREGAARYHRSVFSQPLGARFGGRMGVARVGRPQIRTTSSPGISTSSSDRARVPALLGSRQITTRFAVRSSAIGKMENGKIHLSHRSACRYDGDGLCAGKRSLLPLRKTASRRRMPMA